MAEINADWISENYFDAGGFTGNTYYFRLVRRGDQKVWDNTNKELASAPSWGDTAIAMTPRAGTGDYPVVIPKEVSGGNEYEVVIYQQAGGSPDPSDDVKQTYVQKIGGMFGF
jgi:hypothetical protein